MLKHRRRQLTVLEVIFRAGREGERPVAVEILKEGRTKEKLCEVADNAFHFADGLTEVSLQKMPPPAPLACKEGCNWCCYLHVSATAPEVLRIADHLRENLSAEELTAVKERVGQTDARTRGLDPVGRLKARQPCPLLEDGRCSVYHVRPIACRGWNSFDAEKCKAALDSPLSGQSAYAPQLACDGGVAKGLEEALGQVGLSGAVLELTAALRVALDDEGAADKYLAGEPVFADAKAKTGPPDFMAGGLRRVAERVGK